MTCNPIFHRLRHQLSAWFLCSLTFIALALSGCGNSAGGSNEESVNSGSSEVTIGLTDAEGDFLSYTVDVVSLTLTKANGAVVETLPLTTRVDFAQYVEMTEFVTAATIPSGVYKSATMRLDYSNADIQVETGGITQAASVRDINGQPITMLDVTVKFDDRKALTIFPGVPAHLTLDFNLEASNTVDTSGVTPQVTVDPFLVADVEPETSKPHRVRGPLRSVDTAAGTFQIIIRPFFVALHPQSAFGMLTVVTGANTAYEIDQVHYNDSAGLAQLALMSPFTATVVVGNLDVSNRRFVAREVYAGSSVPHGTSDAITGNIIARTDDTLTVRGASLERSDGSVTFRDTINVQVSASTKVAKQALAATGLTKDDLSVGQRVTIFGTFNPTTKDLDANNGFVRMLVTSLSGVVNNMADGIEVTVQHISGRPVSIYNFAGTGTSPSNDADPAHYEIDTGALNMSGIAAGNAVRVLGFVQPFGNAPKDFTAQTVTNLNTIAANLLVDWNPATPSPFSANTTASVVLDLSNVGLLHHVLRSGVATDLLGLGQDTTIQPRSDGRGLFAIGYRGTVQVYTEFEPYRLALIAKLSNGQKTRGLGAHGAFVDSSATVTADRMFAVMRQ